MSVLELKRLAALPHAKSIPIVVMQSPPLLALSLFLCSGLYTLTVLDNLPLSSCQGGFQGIEVDIVREALTLAGWKYNEEYTFNCYDTNNPSQAQFGGLELTATSYRADLDFSVPTLAGGLSILVSQDIDSTFSTYLGVLDYTLWIAIGGAWLFVAVTLWIFERGNASVPGEFFKGIRETVWISLLGLILVNNYRIKRVSSRVLLLSYWLFSVMIMGLFFACNARNYLIGVSPIRSPEGLNSHRVITCDSCIDSITQYGPLLLDFRVSQGNFDEGVEMLRTGLADALVFDYDFMQGRTAAMCDLVIVSPQFSMYYYVVQMSEVPELKATLDKGLSLLRETSNLKKLEEQYLQADGVCNSFKYDLKPVTFLNMFELWIVWICLFILSFLLRAGIKRTQLLRNHNVHQVELQALAYRPETRILKHTEVFVHNMSQHISSIFTRMERAVKKQNFLQQKRITTMQNLSAKLNQEQRLD